MNRPGADDACLDTRHEASHEPRKQTHEMGGAGPGSRASGPSAASRGVGSRLDSILNSDLETKMNLTDSAGLVLGGATPKALDHLETALHQLRCYTGDPVASADAALDASPEMAMGHLLRAYLHLLGTEPGGLPVARECHRHAVALPL